MQTPNSTVEERIQALSLIVEKIRQGDYEIKIPTNIKSNAGSPELSISKLADDLKQRRREMLELDQITLRINSGLLLDDILDAVYQGFHELIPYNRIGFSLIEKEGNSLKAYWAKTDQPNVHLKKDYEALLHGSSLEEIIRTREPRIINDLEAYLAKKPGSESTALMVMEGMRSSLTCPLIVNSDPVGFMFFSSIKKNAYKKIHIDIYQRIAAQLSVIVEKGRLVSQLTEHKNQIEKQNIELKRLNEIKNTFLGIAAHDLRNPISSIKMLTNMLLSNENPMTVEESQDFINDIHQQSDYMLGLLEDILDVTAIESGKLELHPVYIDAEEFMDEILSRHNRIAEPKRIEVICNKLPKGKIYADPLRLRQVLDNLLSNAIKYSPHGTTITICLLNTDSHWRFEVHDQGPGITAEDRRRLFQDFARLSAKPTGGERSTGLGLAISKRIVEAHGKIGVESHPSRGSNFWFTIPDEGNLL